jgi:enoyl-CoA hydratase/carnithine racemase
MSFPSDDWPAMSTSQNSEKLVRTEIDQNVGVITLVHPPVNAISTLLGHQLVAALREMDARQVRVAVLTGGPRMFSGGFDVNELKVSAPTDAIPRNRHNYAVYRSLEQARYPIIAAINGYAVGGGCELALACDFRVSAADAFFSWPEVNLAGLAHMQRLVRTIGYGQARRLVYTGERWSATEAHRCGLVDVLAGSGDAISEALAIAGKIAAKPPAVVEVCKRAMSFGFEVPLSVAQDAELSMVGEVAGIADRHARLESFGSSTD